MSRDHVGKAAMNSHSGHYSWRTAYLSRLRDDLPTAVYELAAACPIPEADLGLRHVGGVLHEHHGAVGNRDARDEDLFRVNRTIPPATRPASAHPGDAP
jgi:hypothetical protein